MKKVMFLVVLAVAINARAAIEITEWMYQGANGEFVEFTNTGSTAVDMTGWSYSDNHRTAGDVPLGEFGIVAAGESVILTETAAATFATSWGLSSSIKIMGGNATDNLGRSDEINLYDAGSTLIDRLTYDDQTGKGLRTQGKSCGIPASDYDLQTASSTWILSSVGDQYGSWISTGGDIGSPGMIPEPATMAILGLGALILGSRRKS
jgi:uncharacterized protein